MGVKENQTSPEKLQQNAVQLELPADLLTQLEQVKAQADALSGGNQNWLNDTLSKQISSTNLRHIPDEWKTRTDLVKRLDLFLQVMKKNRDWAKMRADKFYIGENSFEFPEIGLHLCIGDYSTDEIQYEWIEKKGKVDISSIPTKDELLYVWNFIHLSGNIPEIREFLGFKEEDYWAQDVYESDNFQALFVLFHNGVDSHSDKNKFKRLRLKHL